MLFLTAVVAVSFLALRTVRGGWAGSFIGLATKLAIWMVWQDGSGELFGLGAGAVVAGVAAFDDASRRECPQLGVSNHTRRADLCLEQPCGPSLVAATKLKREVTPWH